MENIELLRQQLNQLVTQARHDMYSLSAMNDTPARRQILQRLWDTISSIHFLSDYLAIQASTVPVQQPPAPVQPPPPVTYGTPDGYIPPITPLPNQTVPEPKQRNFTLEELATFDGKNGRPVYVAVNGVVYDVTNNRAWAAATHFGLTSGKDYTQEFASCHTGQQSILMTLPVVGRLV